MDSPNFKEFMRRYIAGYLLEESDSGYAKVTLENGAWCDAVDFINTVEDDAHNLGYDRGAADADADTKNAVFIVEAKVNELRKQVAQGEARLSNAISFYLGQQLDTEQADTDNVEKWAYQDGWNEAINAVMRKVVEITENL